MPLLNNSHAVLPLCIAWQVKWYKHLIRWHQALGLSSYEVLILSLEVVCWSTMTLLSEFLYVMACGFLAQRLRCTHSHILYSWIPVYCQGRVVLLVSGTCCGFCHTNILFFKRCQPLVANYTRSVLVPSQFHKFGTKNPPFT